jgi:hypothetical protein
MNTDKNLRLIIHDLRASRVENAVRERLFLVSEIGFNFLPSIRRSFQTFAHA